MPDYADLEISLRPHETRENTYWVETRFRRPGGDQVAISGPLVVELDPDELGEQAGTPADYGRLLAERLFAPPALLSRFTSARDLAGAQHPLRLRLRLGSGDPSLHAIRWEILVDPGSAGTAQAPAAFLAADENVLLSRYLTLQEERLESMPGVGGLRALVVIANPNGLEEAGFAPVEAAQELDNARLGLGNIPFDALCRLDDPAHVGLPTLDELITRLRDGYDLLYLACHGKLVDGKPQIWLEDEKGNPDVVSARQEQDPFGKVRSGLIEQIQVLPRRPLLAVLASCQSAGAGGEWAAQDEDPRLALGPGLVEAGIPAVIGMHGNITMPAAQRFLRVFFNELQRDGQVDRAAAAARGSLLRHSPPFADWWMPVLYLRKESGYLPFDAPGMAIFQALEKAPAPLSRFLFTDKFRTLVEERSRRFVGRGFIFQGIDNHLRDANFPSGYILIRGEPGIGKTAIASQLVKTRGYIHHFNIATQNIRQVRDFLNNLSAQLILRYHLGHDHIPEEASRDSAFLSQLLREAAEKPENRPVIVVVDALDEAEDIGLGANTNRLYLPSSLPEGVYFILTSREQMRYRLSVDRRQDLFLKDSDPQNIEDVKSYIRNFIAEFQDPMLQRIQQWEKDPESFIQLMAEEKSQGNFMYLVHVLQDIRDGRLNKENINDLADLPVGLREYYERHWDSMRQADRERFERLYEPVVCVLAAVREPVSVDKLVQFTKLGRSQIKDVIGEWRQFLNEEKCEGELRYRVYHASFQDFLQDEVGLERFHNMIAQSALDKIPGFNL